MTEREKDITIATEGGDYAEHNIDKRAGQFVEQGQHNQQHVYLDFRAEVEAMSVDQRISASTKAILGLQAEFVEFEKEFVKLAGVIHRVEQLLVRTSTTLVFFSVLLWLLVLFLIAICTYLLLQR